jgi:excisionase family DNA binding protein
LQRLISDPNCRLNWNSTRTGGRSTARLREARRHHGQEDDLEKVLIKPIVFARLASLARSSVYAAIARGEIRAVKIGGAWRIPTSELDRLVHYGERS